MGLTEKVSEKGRGGWRLGGGSAQHIIYSCVKIKKKFQKGETAWKVSFIVTEAAVNSYFRDVSEVKPLKNSKHIAQLCDFQN